jgi:hypothetical protein
MRQPAKVTVEYGDGLKIELEVEFDPDTNTIVIPNKPIPTEVTIPIELTTE